MNAKAFVGALVGGAIGVGVWAIVVSATGWAFGIVAWGVGVAVGIGAVRGGGGGQAAALVSGAIALVAIMTGYVWAFRIAAPVQLKKAIMESLDEDYYTEMLADAEAFAELTSEDEYRRFMIDYVYSLEESPEDVSDEALATFVKFDKPILEDMVREQPSFEVWRKRAAHDTMRRQLSDVETSALLSNLGIMAYVFAILGCVSAYKVVASSGEA